MKKLIAVVGLVSAPICLAMSLAVPKLMMVLLALLISVTSGVAFANAFTGSALTIVTFGLLSATGFARIVITGTPAIDLVLTAY